MDHIPDEEVPAVGKAAHAVVGSRKPWTLACGSSAADWEPMPDPEQDAMLRSADRRR